MNTANGWAMAQAPVSISRNRTGDIVGYNSIRKEKKMGWFKRKFAQWSREAWENTQGQGVLLQTADNPSPKSSVRFTIYPASGGWVIEHCKQDRYKENDGNKLTIITDFADLGKTVEHLITLESLRS